MKVVTQRDLLVQIPYFTPKIELTLWRWLNVSLANP